MRIVATADLHYNIERSREPARQLAAEVCRLEADALLILGDVAGRDAGIVSECLHLFDSFKGRKFFVAGNHDIWTEPGGDSLARLDEELPALCRQAGFHSLDAEPAIVGDIGLVGSIGWYDYSFRPAHLRIPLRFYQAKIAPGAAARLSGFDDLLADTSDIPEEAFAIGTRWMDARHVHLGMSDLDFCHYLLERFHRHLEQVANNCQRIVVGLHHLPFAEMVPVSDRPSWSFARAFLGSEMFGELLADQPKVCCILCGHSHRPDRFRRGHIDCINVGCTYREKRYEVIDV